jgi:flavin-dependent dehydrogenase
MYDAIVVGARCAGSPTAMLLARKGYKVLLVDRGTFPSDMPFSNHYVHQTGSSLLKKWGLLDKLAATNCPPIKTNHWNYGAFTLTGAPPPAAGVPDAYAPRRLRLDPILVDAAVAAGAELREGFSAQEVIWENDRVVGIRGHQRDGDTVTEKARIVIGADGMFSTIAKGVKAPEYNNKPALEGSWYAYWSGVKMKGWHLWLRPYRVMFAYNTNDDLALVGVAFPARELPAVRSDIEGNYMRSIAEHTPDLAEQLSHGRRESRFVGGAIPGYYRRPYGPGWALVGDAAYQKDPCTASGITDAFKAADLMAEAIDAGLSGRQPMEQAISAYEQQRNDRETPYFELTTQLATLDPPPPEILKILDALRNNPEQTSRYFGVFAHTVPVQEFFAPENISRLLG